MCSGELFISSVCTTQCHNPQDNVDVIHILFSAIIQIACTTKYTQYKNNQF